MAQSDCEICASRLLISGELTGSIQCLSRYLECTWTKCGSPAVELVPWHLTGNLTGGAGKPRPPTRACLLTETPAKYMPKNPCQVYHKAWLVCHAFHDHSNILNVYAHENLKKLWTMGCACCRSKAETHARLLFPASIEKLGISPVLSILVKRFRKYDEGMM